MNNLPTIDRGIIAPIGIGILSAAGIVLISLIVYFDEPQASSLADPTTTPFKYLFLATETHTPETEAKLVTPTVIATGESSNGESAAIASPALVVTPNDESLPKTNATPTATNTPAIDLNSVFIEGKYDDIDERVVYEGSWINEIVESAYGETMFISTATGNTATFTFIGAQLQIGYLADPTFGMVLVSIDGIEYPLDQSNGSEWLSPKLQFGEHSVILTHESGELAVLDYIVILGSS